MIGALLSSLARAFPLGKTMIITYMFSAAFWISSAFLPWDVPAVILYGISLIPLGATQVLLAATGQRIIPDSLLVRVFSVISSVSSTAMPIGFLMGGTLGSVLGGQLVFAIGGLGMLSISFVWFIVSDLRRIPRVKDIHPEIYGMRKSIN